VPAKDVGDDLGPYGRGPQGAAGGDDLADAGDLTELVEDLGEAVSDRFDDLRGPGGLVS
jgi:hypothetical protein